jgi:hypothetical protein
VKLIINEKTGLVGIETKKLVFQKLVPNKQTKGSCDRKNTFFQLRFFVLFCFHKAEERLNAV